MAKAANPVTVGAFIIGTALLAVLLVVFFGGGSFFSNSERYVLIYDRSIKGLTVGAPVTIKGVKIGQVVEIKARMYDESTNVLNTVVVELQPDTLEREGNGRARGAKLVDELIEQGLCAQLRLQSLLTGMLYVDVDFRPDKLVQFKQVKTRYKQIPTVPTDLEQLTSNLENIDLNQLGENLEQIVSGVNRLVNDPALQHLGASIDLTLASVRNAADQVRVQSIKLDERLSPVVAHSDQLLVQLNESLPHVLARLDESLVAMRDTAKALEQTAANTTFLTSEDSPLLYRIETAAGNVDAAAEQVRRLTDMLERQPESLLYGKKEEY